MSNYMSRVATDLMQLNLALIKAKRALDNLPMDEQIDAVTARYGGQAFDAIITAHTIADALLREIPLEEIKC